MPKPKFSKGTIKSLSELANLRQQLSDQEHEALRAAQEAAAAKQKASGDAAARAREILNNATGVRTASTKRTHFTTRRKGSGVYVPVGSSGSISKATEQPQIVAKEIQMPQEPLPISGRIKIRSSKNPFDNAAQSAQNAHDLGLSGLEQMFYDD